MKFPQGVWAFDRIENVPKLCTKGTVKEFAERGLDVGQAMRMVHDKNE